MLFTVSVSVLPVPGLAYWRFATFRGVSLLLHVNEFFLIFV